VEESDTDPASRDLLDQLPVGDVKLSFAPEHVLRRMFELFRLQVRYDKVGSWATCRVAIREETLDQLLTDSSALLAAQTNDPDGERPLLVGAPNRSLFEPARPAVSRRELVIAGEFSRLFILPGKPQRDQKSVGPSLRILNCLACYSPRGDRQTSNLSDLYPISVCGRVGNSSAGGTSGSGGLIIRWSLVRVQPAPPNRVRRDR
jgi:hypothetical protein